LARSFHFGAQNEMRFMLFPVTMTHAAHNCSAFHSETVPTSITSVDRPDELGTTLNVRAHSLLCRAPDLKL
jgi:hypothetical protein